MWFYWFRGTLWGGYWSTVEHIVSSKNGEKWASFRKDNNNYDMILENSTRLLTWHRGGMGGLPSKSRHV